MNPSTCLRCSDGQDTPSYDEWKANEALIRRLYSQEGLSLKQVQAELHTLRGHHASERQYKTKFKSWQLRPKRICRKYYIAMKRVLDEFPQHTHTIIFGALRGEKRTQITSQAITKELGRSPGPKDISLTFSQAQEILSYANITYDLQRPPSSRPVGLSDDDEDTDESIFSTPRDILTPSDMSTPGNVSTPWNILTPRGTLTPSDESLLLTPRDISSVENEPYCLLPPPSPPSAPFSYSPNEGLDFHEIGASFGAPNERTSIDSKDSILPLPIRCRPARGAAVKDAKSMAQKWADPWLGLEQEKSNGLRAFEWMLRNDPSNPYIFPLLFQMMAVLQSNDRPSDLEDFVANSCRVFDIVTERQSAIGDRVKRIPGASLQTMFLYIKAAVQERTDALREHGLRLPRVAAYLVRMLGANHPHVHSANLMTAWHLMNVNDYTKALELLDQCREDIVRSAISWDFYKYNVFGLAAQAQAAQGEHELAIHFFGSALASLDSWPSVRQHHEALSWDIELQLAHSFAQCDQMDAAMAIFEKVIKGRIRRFSYKHGRTWDAIQKYHHQLEAWGRADDAQTLMQFHEMRYDTEHIRETGYDMVEHLPYAYRNATTPTFANADLQHQTVQELISEASIRRVV
jgi:tetratricopeptide (TPR) repeat protein